MMASKESSLVDRIGLDEVWRGGRVARELVIVVICRLNFALWT